MDEIAPTEGLMREHGVLKRVLLATIEKQLGIYDLGQFTPKA